ncbi:unnamed protein product [Ectocarpus sp. CCAP 1310/34]|nr:unnamed protein product [Ectocarpus sp. CCAP 1310/34]
MVAKYAVGVNSCSSAILIGLMCVGVKAGDEVLTNAFTFTAVPSTILRLGAKPCLVECGDSWTMDLDDLEKKANGGRAKVLLLSHMRGKVCDMDRVSEICERHRLTLVEDCAHAAGVTWRGRQLGYHAKVSAFSTQSDKVINSGEGGFVTTSDDEMAAKAIYLSGAYEGRYSKHLVRPSDALCEAARFSEPNLSVRMSETTAAVLRPLLKSLPSRVLEYNRRYNIVVKTMEAEALGLIDVPKQHELVGAVGDHLNFRLKKFSDEGNLSFQAKCKELGVPVNWLRSGGNARWHVNWRGFGCPAQDLPVTDSALAMAYDLKLPPYFEDEDFVHLARIIAYAARSCCRSAADGGGSPRVSPQHQQEEVGQEREGGGVEGTQPQKDTEEISPGKCVGAHP